MDRITTTGFTLAEVAIVLIIISLLMGSLLAPLSSKMKQEKIKQTEQILVDITEALLGYVVINRALPCPDTYNDGEEDREASGQCSTFREGYLPWAALGLEAARKDAWGRPFRYRVEQNFTEDIRKLPDLTNITPFEIRTFRGKLLNTADTIDSNAVAIIFSCGADGRPNGRENPNDISGYPSHEYGNDADGYFNAKAICDNPGIADRTYIQSPFLGNDNYIQPYPSENSHTDTILFRKEFDDILIWLPKSILINRLVVAGRWP
jgi:type II secretory pathway pseudopilin PulG